MAVDPVHSNIVFVDFSGPMRERVDAFAAHLNAQGVMMTGLYRMRFVTHLDVDDAAVDRAAEVIRAFFNA